MEKFTELCSVIDPAGGYKFCPGIDTGLYETRYLSVIRYDLKSVREISDPIARIDSEMCTLWHKLACNSNLIERGMDTVLCQACKRLRSDLEQQLKTSSKVTIQEKENPAIISLSNQISHLIAKKRTTNIA